MTGIVFVEDAQFLQAFHNGILEAFRHRDHLRLAWLVLKHHGVEEALGFVKEGIKGYAQSKGATTLYHETLTAFWVRLVVTPASHHQRSQTSSNS